MSDLPELTPEEKAAFDECGELAFERFSGGHPMHIWRVLSRRTINGSDVYVSTWFDDEARANQAVEHEGSKKRFVSITSYQRERRF